MDRALGGAIGEVLGSGDFKGRRGQTLTLYPGDGVAADRVLLVGLGDDAGLDPTSFREAAGSAVRAAESRGGGRLVLLPPPTRRVRAPQVAQALAEGSCCPATASTATGSGAKTRPRASSPLSCSSTRETPAPAAPGRPRVWGSRSRRTWPATSRTSRRTGCRPWASPRAAEKLAKEVGLKVRVLEPAELRRRKLGAMLAVAQGSANPPRLIVLEHNAPSGRGKKSQSRRKRKTVCLIGKGVCFDSGGLSLKPSASMVKMKHDMSGAAAVIGAMRAAAVLDVPHHVVGIVGAVENMPSGTAYRPDDVVTSGSGKTVEITNTDAEGRLVLADCLHFAQTEYEPVAMIDLATLTGACAVALGSWAAAVLGNHDRLIDVIQRAGESVGRAVLAAPALGRAPRAHAQPDRGREADRRPRGRHHHRRGLPVPLRGRRPLGRTWTSPPWPTPSAVAPSSAAPPRASASAPSSRSSPGSRTPSCSLSRGRPAGRIR